jgi:serine/threonine protein kinase
MPEPNFDCNYCGTPGYNSPAKMKRNNNNFCSKDCSIKYSTKKIEIFCNGCGKNTLKSLYQFVRSKKLFCSSECHNKYKNKKVEVECLVCKKLFLKDLFEVNRSPRNCCSQYCYKILQKYHKDWGSNRSKLECAIEKNLYNIFPFEIIYNKTHIGYELDINIPSLSLAFEFNGIFHYKPIYGIEKLLRVQQIDREKVAECKKRNIKLIVIDVSKDKSTKKVIRERFEQVLSIINERIEELNFPSDTYQFSMML